MIHRVSTQTYGRPLSTVFGTSSLDNFHSDNDEDNEPPLALLRFIDYRYLRFIYNPLEDKFQLVNGWKDPSWTNVKLMRSGLDVDERDSRERVFGRNLIDVHQKSMFQLLVDEVRILQLFPSEKNAHLSLNFPRFFTRSISLKLQVWSCGLWMSTITMQSASLLFPYSALVPLLWRRGRYVFSGILLWHVYAHSMKTMSRLREISHFECNVRVLRNGFCESYNSCVFGDMFSNRDFVLIPSPKGELFHQEKWSLETYSKFRIRHSARYLVTAYSYLEIV